MKSGSSSEHTCTFSRPTLPTFQNPSDFDRYSTEHWTCRVCIRDSLRHLYLMRPEIAAAHERSAYHRFMTKDPLYQFRQPPDEQNTAWEGPSKFYDTFDWLKAQEFKAHNDEKEAQWNKDNPDWNKYNPDEDEFLHPNLETTWRNKKPKRRPPKDASKKCSPKKKNNQEDRDDIDSLKVLRKGLGHFVYDPVPKPRYNTEKWLLGVSEATKDENYAPAVNWKEKLALEDFEAKDMPLSNKTTESLLQFGQKYAKYAKLSNKRKEEMHLFLELPTAEKVRRIELLAMRLCDPSQWDHVIDQPEYWN